MVSIVAHSDYISQCKIDSHLSHFTDFLLGIDFYFEGKESLTDANDIAVHALKAIAQNVPEQYQETFNLISRRRPKRESDWLHNDVLLFACTLGVAKFGLDESWLREVLSLRRQYADHEKNIVVQTFLDVLNKNFESTGNCRPLMLVMKSFLDLPIGKPNDVNQIYTDLIRKPFPFFASPFLNLIALRTIDLIILSREPTDLAFLSQVKEFLVKFRKRTHQISNAIWIVLFIGSIMGSVWFAFYFLQAKPQLADLLDRILTLLPFLGFGGLIPMLVVLRSKILKYIENSLFRYYGFDQD